MSRKWEVRGDLIRSEREKAGFTVSQLAALMDVREGVVVGVEKGYWTFRDLKEAQEFVSSFQGALRVAQKFQP